MRKTSYEYTKTWRHKHPDRRNEDRRKYYHKTAWANDNKHIPFTEQEVELIMKHDRPDSQLAEEIGRSVQSIQCMRCRKKKEYASKEGK